MVAIAFFWRHFKLHNLLKQRILDFEWNKAVANHFQAGEVSFVRVVRDRGSGLGKGFGFVGFKDTSSVPVALKLDGSVFQQRNISVKNIEKKKVCIWEVFFPNFFVIRYKNISFSFYIWTGVLEDLSKNGLLD